MNITKSLDRKQEKGRIISRIYNFHGRAVTLAKKKSKGNYHVDELSGLNQRAELLKKQTNGSKRKRIFGRSTDYDYWLERV